MTGALDTYILLLLVGFLPNEVWRMLGLVFGHGIDEESELFSWARAVATAVLAGVIAKILLFPPGALAIVPLVVRDRVRPWRVPRGAALGVRRCGRGGDCVGARGDGVRRDVVTVTRRRVAGPGRRARQELP
jgi:hypothetical protein